MSIIPTASIDYTNKDYRSFKAFMIEQLKVLMPEYTDTSETDAGIVILELLAKGLDILSFYQDVQANEAFLLTEEQRVNALKWCSMLDYIPRSSIPSKVEQVFVLAFAHQTSITIPAGTKVQTMETSSEYAVAFETEEDLVIPAGYLGNEKDDDGNYIYSVTAVQGYTIQGEVLGSSDNTPDQRFSLNYTPVIQSSVAVLVNEGTGFEPWVRVDTLLDSKPTDKHFVVEMNDNDGADIVFGNGVTGKIPNSFTEGIIATYRVGGGSQGNVGANKITQLDSNISAVDRTFNPYVPFELGYDKETLTEIKKNAPSSYRTKWSCLIEKDYADKVKELFPEVALSSSKRSSTNVDEIDVFVLLHNNDSLTEELRNDIMSMFESRALVGTTVNLVPAEANTFVPLDLDISIQVKDRFSRKEIDNEVRAMFSSYFQIGYYDYGKECSVSDLETMIKENNLGVKSVRVTTSSSISSSEDLVITPDVSQILTLGKINIDLIGGINDL